MTGLQRAFQRYFLADTTKVVLPSNAVDGEVLNVGAGDLANLYVDAYVLVWSPNGPAANHLKVVRIYEIDSGNNRVKVDPTLPATPEKDDELRLGVTHWVAMTGAIRYRRPAYSTPVQDLDTVASAWECVVLYGEQRRPNVVMDVWAPAWELRAISKSPRHSYGCAERLKRLVHGRTSDLAAHAKGMVLAGLRASEVEENQRDDKFFEFQVRAELDTARKVA